METEKVIYSGYLLLPPQGKIVLKKSWQQKFCVLYKNSKFGRERLEIYDSIEDTSKLNANSKIITLENCIKIAPVSSNIFIVKTKNTQYEFEALTEDDLTDWVTSIQSVAFKDDVSKITSIEEDNDLYCSSGEGIFQVTLWPSEASKRCGLEPNKIYTLILTPSAILLRGSLADRILYKWPYCYIRRYGYRSGKFTFEAGRKCESGEGVFHLEHSNQQEIFRCLSSKMKSMKKILSGESCSSLLDCGDNQFQAALSMEARSRSPLPPSPTSSTRIHDIDLSNSNPNSMKNMSESFEKSITDRRPLPKPRPDKPLRKTLIYANELNEKLASDVINNSTVTTPQSNSYDVIECRKDAWRTHGLPDNSQIDIADDELEEYMSWSRAPEPVPNNPTSIKNSTKIITKLSNLRGEMYDKLQFFGSSSKLANIQPGYKQVAPVAMQPTSTYVPSWGEYDEVEINMQAVRLADDSHLGYGMIRKNPQPKVTESSQVAHQVYNDNEYAVVSKTKQV